MFNQNEFNYVKELVQTRYDDNYLCYKNYVSNTNDYDVYCYFSKSDIVENSKSSFTIKNYTKYSLDSSSYSSSNLPFIYLEQSSTELDLNVSTRSSVFTNAKDSVNADIRSDYNYLKKNNWCFSPEYIGLILIMLALIIANNFIFGLFKRS